MVKKRGLNRNNERIIFGIIILVVSIVWLSLYFIKLLPLESVLTLLVLSITAFFALFHLIEISRARRSTAFLELYKYLQQEYVREARGTLIKLGKKKREYKDWKYYEEKDAEIACHTYDLAGIMVRKKLIEEDLVVNPRLYSITQCWDGAKKWIEEKLREKQKRGKDFWAGFEFLYNRATEIKEKEEKKKKHKKPHNIETHKKWIRW